MTDPTTLEKAELELARRATQLVIAVQNQGPQELVEVLDVRHRRSAVLFTAALLVDRAPASADGRLIELLQQLSEELT